MKNRNSKHQKQNRSQKAKNGNKVFHYSEVPGIGKVEDISGVSSERKKSLSHVSGVTRHGNDKNGSFMSTEENNMDDFNKSKNIFPKYFQWVVFMITLLVRVNYVSNKENWWILHPDEVFQSLEVAHSEVYGYGFRPYEYMPPPDGANTSTSVSDYQEHRLGMYSLRSFMFPYIFMIIAKVTVLFGWQKSPFIIWKIFHACVTSCLPLSVYRFSNELYKSHDIAVISSILVASSTYINVLGTHTFINSFLSPLLFFTALEILKTVLKISSDHDQNQATDITKLSVDYAQHGNVNGTLNTISNDLNDNNSSLFVDHNRNYKVMNGVSQNGNYSLPNGKGELIKDVGYVDYKLECFNLDGPFNDLEPKEQIYLKPEILNNEFRTTRESRTCLFMKGLLLGIILYIRVDTSFLLFFLFIPYIFTIVRNVHSIIASLRMFITGSVVGIFVCIYDDINGYDAWVISLWQWLNFNIVQSMSSKIFGTHALSFYFQEILFQDGAMVLFFVISFIVLVIYLSPLNKYLFIPLPWQHFNQNKNIIFTITALFFAYTLQGHKERRFMHDTMVLLLVFYSSVIFYMCHIFINFLKPNLEKPFIWSIFILYISSQWNNFPSYKDKSNAAWAYGRYHDSNHVNICLDFIGQQNDVTGVYIDASLHVTGGYTILHKNVSIISLMHKEFYEFDSDARIVLGKRYRLFSNDDKVSLLTLRKISDFISVRNTQYLLKVLINKKKYNYLILRAEREFITTGYNEIFRSDTFRILKRSFKRKDELKLQQMADTIPLGPSVLILNYESNWLITYGLYEKAEKKLILSLQIDRKNIQTLHLLTQLYRDQKKFQEANSVYNICRETHDSEKCLQTPKRIVLHKEYNLDLEL